jgi:uncharacterized protein
MVITKDNLINELKDILFRINKTHNIREAYLFGSYAKGNPKQYSDIDIAIVLSKTNDSSNYDESFEIFHEMQKCNSLLEPLCFFQDKFIDEDDLVRNIKKEGIRLL